MIYDDTITRVELELSIGWSAAHPELFRDAVTQFMIKYSGPEWATTTRVEPWAFFFIAGRRGL